MQSKAIQYTLSAIILCGATISCTGEVDTFDNDEFRVLNGASATSDVNEYAATVGLHQRSGDQIGVSPFCTGTMLNSEVVLTAAHCCDEAANGPSFNPMEPAEVAIYFGDGPAFNGNSFDPDGDLYAVSEVLIHPSYNRNSLREDICMLRLSLPNDAAATVPHLPASEGVTNNDQGTLADHVGFGYSNEDKTEYGVKLHAQVPIVGLGCAVSGCPLSDPGYAGQFSYTQSGNNPTGPCNGDSGGPAFISRSGQTYVAGITSYGDAQCTLYGVSTNVSHYETFINDFIGVPPGPGPDCSDDGVCNNECGANEDPDCGGGGGSCGDDVCDDGESCDGRGGTTSCSSDCAGKTSGKKKTRYCAIGDSCDGPGCCEFLGIGC